MAKGDSCIYVWTGWVMAREAGFEGLIGRKRYPCIYAVCLCIWSFMFIKCVY